MKTAVAALLVSTSWLLGQAHADSVEVQLHLEAENLLGQPITTVPVGSAFQLAVFVQDIRTPPNSFPGVFSAYLNVAFDPSLASITATPHAPNAVDPGIVFGPQFSIAHTGDLSTPGLINAGGGSNQQEPLTTADQFLFKVTVHATHAGMETFTSSFDTNPGHDFLLASPINELTADQVDFGQTSVTVVPEPASALLAMMGLVALSAWRAQRRFARGVRQA